MTSRSIFAIDPGNKESGWVHYAPISGEVLEAGVWPNNALLFGITSGAVYPHDRECVLAIEMMKARGMPVSNDEMETLVWIGRYMQAWRDPNQVHLAYRADVKLHICGSAKAKDANVSAALKDRIGKRGTKKHPGPTYGVTSHAWPALAVAVYVQDHEGKQDAFARFTGFGHALRQRSRL